MSHRPRQQKKIRKLEKALRRTPATSIDLVQWLRDRRYADTAGGARKLLEEGKVLLDGEPCGRVEIKDGEDSRFLVFPMIPASRRADLSVAE